MRTWRERPVVEVGQRVHRVGRGRRGARCRRGRPGTGSVASVNRSRGAGSLGDPLGDLGGAVVGAVVDQDHVLDGLEHRRQHPRQVARLVLDPEHAGEPRRQRPVRPRPSGRRSRGTPRGRRCRATSAQRSRPMALRSPRRADAGTSARRPCGIRSAPRSSDRRPAGGAVGVALAARDHAVDWRDRLGLVVERGVRRAQLVEERVHVGGVAARLGELVEPAPGLLGELAQPGRDLDVVPGQLHPAQVRVDELVHLADVVGRRGLDRARGRSAWPSRTRGIVQSVSRSS